MLWLLSLALVTPIAAIACLLLGGSRWTPRVALAATGLAFVLSLALTWRVLAGGALLGAGGWLHADALAALIVCIVTGSSLAASWYGRDYMRHVGSKEQDDARWSPGRYKALTLGLVASLVVAAIANNLGLLWVAIESGTLCSALLVGYYRRPGAIEAGWKYLLLSSVGIALALFATVLLYYSAVGAFGEGGAGLQWRALREVAASLDPRFVRLAFVFALVGYGTKAGIAPMHSWMPDAYSQAPTPASALMSTALLATALGALLRFHSIAVAALGPDWSGGLLVVFGALSLVIAVPFLLVQGEFKRLLAWSSLEHTGLVLLAVGIGTPLALFAGLFHLVNQSLAKSLAFLVGGSLGRATDSRRMDHWSGALEASPALGVLLLGAGIGLTGLPPAGTFFSEWLIVTSGLAGPHRVATTVAIVALAVAFAGLAYHWTRMLLGTPRPGFADPLPRRALAPLWALLALLLLLGVWLPAPFRHLLEQAARDIGP